MFVRRFFLNVPVLYTLTVVFKPSETRWRRRTGVEFSNTIWRH